MYNIIIFISLIVVIFYLYKNKKTQDSSILPSTLPAGKHNAFKSSEQFADFGSKLYEARSPQFAGKNYSPEIERSSLLSRLSKFKPMVRSAQGVGAGGNLVSGEYDTSYVSVPAEISSTQSSMSPPFFVRPGMTATGTIESKRVTPFAQQSASFGQRIQSALSSGRFQAPASVGSIGPVAGFQQMRRTGSFTFPRYTATNVQAPANYNSSAVTSANMQIGAPPAVPIYSQQPVYYPAGTPGTVVLYGNQAVPIAPPPVVAPQAAGNPPEVIIGSLVNYVDQIYMPLYMAESPESDGYYFFTKTADNPINYIPVYLNGKSCLDFGGCSELLDGYNVYIPQFDRNFIVKIGSY